MHMEDLYGVQPSCSLHDLSMHAPVAPPDYDYCLSPGPISFPMLGSEQLFAGSSVSDSASPVAEIQKGLTSEEEASSAIRARIASHPLYPKLLEAYIDTQKVGAPPEMVSLLDEIRQESDLSKKISVATSLLGVDPELDEFMETYCQILAKYKSDLSRPFHEATTFLNDIETQFNTLCKVYAIEIDAYCFWEARDDETVGSSDEDTTGEVQGSCCLKEDKELRETLLRKYSSYISTLRHEFSKKKKKGKLPNEARQVLLNWWNIHYKWPYPTEADKHALADATGLDQKQINNWFINQRKRHWKPSEDMQFAVVDSLYGPFFHE